MSLSRAGRLHQPIETTPIEQLYSGVIECVNQISLFENILILIKD